MGGGFKRCNSHLTAYITVLKFLQVSVKSITHFKIVIVLYMPVVFLSTANTISLIRVNTVCYVCIKQPDVAIIDSFIKTTFTGVNGLNIINNYI